MNQLAVVFLVSVLLGFTSAKQKATQCPSDWVTMPGVSNKCYKAYTEKLDWFEADRFCANQETGSVLSSVTSHFENNFLYSYLNKDVGLTPAVWIGLHKTGENAFSWNDGSVSNFRNWAPGQPGTDPADQCVRMDRSVNGEWTNADCSLQNSFLCELYLQSPCPEGWVYHADFNACFKVFEGAYLSWHESAVQCRRLGGTLPEIHAKDEGDFIASLLSNDNYWVGLFSMNSNSSTWLWSNGDLPGYYNWNAGKPNNRLTNFCTQIIGKHDPAAYGKWTNEVCMSQYSFVCKKPALGTHQC